MWKRINALRRIYQRTRNNEELRESRKHRYFEEKQKYQIEIRKEKFNHHNSIRKIIEEPIHTCDDTDFTQEEIKQTIESFNKKKAPGIDGITSGIFLEHITNSPD
jgi:hypothetical protein